MFVRIICAAAASVFLPLFGKDRDELLVEMVAVVTGNLFTVHGCHGHFPAGAALLDAALYLDVQVGKFFLKPPENLAFAFVVLAESYLHLRSSRSFPEGE